MCAPTSWGAWGRQGLTSSPVGSEVLRPTGRYPSAEPWPWRLPLRNFCAGNQTLAGGCGRGPRNVEEAPGHGHSWDTCVAKATKGRGVLSPPACRLVPGTKEPHWVDLAWGRPLSSVHPAPCVTAQVRALVSWPVKMVWQSRCRLGCVGASE